MPRNPGTRASGGGKGGGDGRIITEKTARLAGFNSASQFVNSPNYATKVQGVERQISSEKKRVKAATGKLISTNKAVNNIYNRM